MQDIIFTRSAFDEYRRTVAKQPPETGGILVGSLDAPYIITCFRFCPPEMMSNGRYNADATVFGPNTNYVNWAIDNEWGPNGLYILGFLHSHPQGCTQLSGGKPFSRKGDIPALSAILEAPETQAAGLNQLLAPITTFNDDGADEIHGWILRRGSTRPERANVVVREEVVAPQGAPSVPAPSPQRHSYAEEQSDLIDTFLCRQHLTLRRPELGFFDRLQARRCYGHALRVAIDAAATRYRPPDDTKRLMPPAE